MDHRLNADSHEIELLIISVTMTTPLSCDSKEHFFCLERLRFSPVKAILILLLLYKTIQKISIFVLLLSYLFILKYLVLLVDVS